MSKTIRLEMMILCFCAVGLGQRTVESTTITKPAGSPPTSTPSRNRLPKVDQVRGSANGGTIRVVDSSITDTNSQVTVAGDISVVGNNAGVSGDVVATGNVQSASVITGALLSNSAIVNGTVNTGAIAARSGNVFGNLSVGGNISGNGTGLFNVNASFLGGRSPDAFLLLSGGTLSGGLAGTTASFSGSSNTLSSLATAVNGTAINAQSTSDGGIAIFGHSADTTPGGHTIGVFGQTDGPEGNGVYGLATCVENCSKENAGVRGEIHGDHGRAVFGFANSTVGNGRGVVGRSDAEDGIGVLGSAQSGSGKFPTGVFGQTLSPYGFGVIGATFEPNGAGGGGTGVNGFVGNGVAIWGQASTGIAGLFETSDAGTPLVVRSPAGQVFSVKGDGVVHAEGFELGGADFAESLRVVGERKEYEAGDVLAIDTESDVQLTKTRMPYSKLVAGIVSTKPGVLASHFNTAAATADNLLRNEVPLAVVGIVPCKVTGENGPIRRGDFLVTSSRAGYAMRGTDEAKLTGAVLGKALEPMTQESGTIQVLVTLR